MISAPKYIKFQVELVTRYIMYCLICMKLLDNIGSGIMVIVLILAWLTEMSAGLKSMTKEVK